MIENFPNASSDNSNMGSSANIIESLRAENNELSKQVKFLKKQNADLTLVNAHLKDIVTASSSFVFLLDASGMFVDYISNDPAKFYVKPSQFLGKRVNEVLPPEIADSFEEGMNSISAKPTFSFSYEISIDGAEHRYKAVITKTALGLFAASVQEQSGAFSDAEDI